MSFSPEKFAHLFDRKKVGYFAERLFNQLGHFSYGWKKDSPLHLEKNFSLKKWNPEGLFRHLTAKFVVFGRDNVLIILDEDFRHRCRAILDEANHYYNGSMKVHGIFLTHSGEPSPDPRFVSMSYQNLTGELDKLMDLRKSST